MKTMLLFGLSMLLLPASPVQDTVRVPTAEDILVQYAEAIGWNEDVMAGTFNNVVETGELLIVEAGIRIQRKAVTTKDGKFYSRATAPQIGEISRGYDGDVFWEKTTNTGLRVLKGGELAAALDGAAFQRYANFRKSLKSYEFAGIETIDAQTVYALRVTTVNDMAETWYFNRDTKLLQRIVTTMSLPQGTFDVSTDFSDYREVDGLLHPFSLRVRLPGQTRIYTVTSLEQNVETDASIFRQPSS